MFCIKLCSHRLIRLDLSEGAQRESVLSPHPVTCVLMEVVREIFEAAARSDPDAPLDLLENCIAWRTSVPMTPSIWNNIYITLDDLLKALSAFLLFSQTSEYELSPFRILSPTSPSSFFFSDGYSMSSLLRISIAHEQPPETPCVGCRQSGNTPKVKNGILWTLYIALIAGFKKSLLAHAEEIFQSIWCGSRW